MSYRLNERSFQRTFGRMAKSAASNTIVDSFAINIRFFLPGHYYHLCTLLCKRWFRQICGMTSCPRRPCHLATLVPSRCSKHHSSRWLVHEYSGPLRTVSKSPSSRSQAYQQITPTRPILNLPLNFQNLPYCPAWSCVQGLVTPLNLSLKMGEQSRTIIDLDDFT